MKIASHVAECSCGELGGALGLRLVLASLMCVALASFGRAAESTVEKPVDFARQILPILSNKCFVCHGPDTPDDDQLRLDSFSAATGDRGGYRAIDPAAPEESELLFRIHSEDSPMPPEEAEKQLTDQERELLNRWVLQGGQYTRHWAFVPPTKQRPNHAENVPADEMIDAFILARMREAGARFAPEADAATLARRAALVLTGLPPEPEQLADYLADEDAAAFERLIDQLLSSPRYGEHQARYWLDAVRYGDTHGLHLDNRRGIYPYRDWVVRAFNKNLPLDDFITWQLAGDLLPDPTLEQRVATGFVRMNPTTSEGGALPEEFQCKNNFDRTETLGTVFLGMSLTCARCHTHKYDPIPQTEYYRLLAFFNSTAENAMDGNSYTYGPVVNVPRNQAAWQSWEALLTARDELLSRADLARELNKGGEKSDDVAEAPAAWEQADAARRLEMVADAEGPWADTPLRDQARDLAERLAAAEKDFTTTLVAQDLDSPRPTHVLRRGEYNLPLGEPLEPGVISVMGELPPNTPRNRLGLARWLTSREHPLVARVLINRVWQRVFGEGLVRTPEDFGAQGQPPTHPELLDWLAVELQDSGWDLKHMLRLMVTSRTFRQSSAIRADVDDPENKLFARGPRYRLDAEVIRDVGLWAGGLLNTTMGGEGVKPYQPDGMWAAMAHPASNTKKYVRDQGKRLYYRSLYVFWKRTSPHPMMTLFDAPSRESSCVRRSRTNTSLQSLGLLNETQRIEMSRALAERLLVERESDADRLRWLFELLACRAPHAKELQACEQLLQLMLARYGQAPEDALALLSQGDAPRDKSLDPARHAAWTQVASTVLASDVAILLY